MKREVSPEVRQSWTLAKQLRQPWEGRWQRLLELAMPYRTSFFNQDMHGKPPVTIYDETALVGIEEMASRLLTGIMPPGQQWARLDPAEGWDQKQRAGFQDIQDEMFRVLDRSNFTDQTADVFKDLAGMGNCCIRLTGGDWMSPIRALAIPFPNVWITPGADGRWADIHVSYRLPAYVVRAQWPGAYIPEDMLPKAERGEHRLTVVDSWVRNLRSPVEHWLNEVHIEGNCAITSQEEKGHGSCPYIFARWASVAGELYGIGQGMVALPAIETVNEVRRQILALGELAMAGMWQAEDDGVLNPYSIQLEPGTIIPIAPQSRGLMPLQHPGTKVDLGLMELSEQRGAIRKALFNETLGPREGTPPTAFEVEQRTMDLMRSIGPAYHRVWQEYVLPVLGRVRRILVDQGRIQMPLIDGRRLRVVATSSMVRAQAVQDVQRATQWAMNIGQLYGQPAIAQLMPAERFAAWSADRYDVPPGLPATAEEQQANAQKLGQIMGEAQASGQEQTLAPLLAAMGGGKM